MSALPIFPGRFQPSIFGANELNYRVRDGNGWTLIAKNTDLRLRYSALVSFSVGIIYEQVSFVNSFSESFFIFFIAMCQYNVFCAICIIRLWIRP